MMQVDLPIPKDMTWAELRKYAKAHNVQTGRRKRVDVEAELLKMGEWQPVATTVTTDEHGNTFVTPTQGVVVTDGSVVITNPTMPPTYVRPDLEPDVCDERSQTEHDRHEANSRIAELETQLAQALQDNGQQQPAKPQGGVGPNYWLWTHTQRKTELIGEGMNPAQFGGNKDAEIAALQANDHRTRGVKPFRHPSLPVNVVEDYQPILRPCTISPLNSMGSPMNGARRIIDNAGNCIAAVYRQGKVVAGVETIMDMEANATTVLEAFNG